jgi:predicted DCC family thiol-disulfide oxidoreductase YuxK
MPASAPDLSDRPAIVLFDGVCNFCNGSVHFIVDRDPAGRFRFAAQQSPEGARLLRQLGLPPAEGAPESILLVEGDRVYDRSTAALRIARRLRFPWWLLYGLIAVPRPLRDLVYGFIARNRYRWFGRTEQCRLPTPSLRARFLSDGA